MRWEQSDKRLDLLDAFLRCIAADEGFAREIAAVADACERRGNHPVALALRNIGRNHRIRGMEGRARIAVLDSQGLDDGGGLTRPE